MVQVIWTKQAADDLDLIRLYVEEFDRKAASRLTARLIAAAESLGNFPNRGRPGGRSRRALTTVWPYLILYRFERDTVRILSVRHGARRPEEP